MDNALFTCTLAADEAGWTPWQSLGGSIENQIAALQGGGGTTEVFAKGLDGDLWHIGERARQWGVFASFGIPIHNASVGVRSNGKFVLMACGRDNRVYCREQMAIGLWEQASVDCISPVPDSMKAFRSGGSES
jgi:hypothetical protein